MAPISSSVKLIRIGTSIEIKARCPDPARVRAVLKTHRAVFKGLDHQIDTYFHIPSGRPASKTERGSPLSVRQVGDFSVRLKLREGNIENALIYYKRADQKNSKQCDSALFLCAKKTPLKKVLIRALGVLTVVDKKREIYFIRNVKFHVDQVRRLGKFVEIEVFGCGETAKLKAQCEFYQRLLGIKNRDLVADSYSDQILKASATRNGQRST